MKITWTVLLLLLGSAIAGAQRLPQNAVPSHYDLQFTPNMNSATFSGDETIQLRLLQASDTITLNSAEIVFDETTVSAGGTTQTATVTTDPEDEMAALKVPQAIPAGPATVRIKFRGILNDKLRGFYLSQADGRKYAVTQFEATDARRAFPSFDEPAYKATFSITLIAPKGDMAISNEKVISDTPGPGPDRHTVKFATTAKLPTYLVALLVGNFDCTSGGADGIPMRVCVTPENKGMTAFALTALEHIVPYYDRYYGIKYPFGKLDLIGIPDFAAGAMENAGAITFRETALLVDPKHASENQRKNVAGTIAHEVAHQWFGDLVTMKWWNDIWLNEGFATFMALKPVDAWQPQWHEMMDAPGEKNWAEGADSMPSSHSIRAKEANTPREIATLFDGISYGKGASVLHMVESYLGEASFRKGIQDYLHAHEYGNATSEDLWNALGKASGKPVPQIMSTFVLQPGVPLLGVSTACHAGTTRVSVTQQRYFQNAAELAKGSSELWNIPLCYRAPGQKEQACHLVTKQQESFTVPGCGAWFNADAGGMGYYIVSYGGDDFSKLVAAVGDLTPAERMNFNSDTWRLVDAGRQPIGDGLKLVEALHNDRGPVLESVLGRVDAIGDRIVSPSDRGRYQQWVRATFRPVLSDIGWTPKPGESDDVRSARPRVIFTLGYTGGDPQVVEKAQQLAQSYLKDPSAVSPDLAGTVLDIAAAHGDAPLYDAYLKAMREAASPALRYAFFNAIPYFTSPALVERTMGLAMSPEVRTQDMGRLIFGIFDQPAAQRPAWTYLTSHYGEYSRRLPGGLSEEETAMFVTSFCDAGLRDDVQSFLSAKLEGHPQRPLREALDRINNCISAREMQAPRLADWLQDHAAAGGR
jgi:aminopeptidase N